MGIMDIFNTKPAETSNKPVVNTPQPGKDNLSDNPQVAGEDGKMPGTSPNMENPLDSYKKMFDNANNSSELQAPSFKIDSKVLNDVSSKMDFTRGINQEVLNKATSGDASALMDIIKTVGQNAYKASLEHNTALTDTYLSQRGEFDKKSLEKGVKSQLTSEALSNAPNYNHPVVKAELNRIASQFAAANPDSNPQEIAKAAQKYISDLQSALNPSDPNKNSDGSDKPEEMDWSKYLNG